MSNFKTVRGISILFLIILVVFFNGCKEPVDIHSKWLDKKIVIDADDADWVNYPFFYDVKSSSGIGLYNDDKNLFIYFQTTDKDLIRQISGQGVFLWFNKTGKKDKELALFFPSKRKVQQGATPDEELKILSSEKDKGYKCNLEKAKKLGIEVKYSIDDRGRFIYELKMPIVETANTAFVAEASDTNNIGMGFITGEEKGRSHPHPGGMDRGGMDRGPMDNGNMQRNEMPGGMGERSMPDEGMEKSGKSFEIWFNVTLASKPMKE
jgi:hypothetical protein